MPTAIDERADLSSGLMRQFGQLTGKLGRQDLVWLYAPGVKLFQAANLIGLEPGSISNNVSDNYSFKNTSSPARFEKGEQSRTAYFPS